MGDYTIAVTAGGLLSATIGVTAVGGSIQIAQVRGDLGVEGARIIDPGSPDTSVLYLRMISTGADRMPPQHSFVDEQAVAVIRRWIEELRCPE